MTDSIQQFVDSYARVGAKDLESGGFFDAFYQRFVASSPSIAEKFQYTDMARQREMLRVSLDHMVYFAIDKEETAEISRVASAHANTAADVPAHLYEIWLDSLLATVSEFDPQFDPEIEAAWRSALAPSIDYMQRHYDAGETNSSQ
ncbi:MAG: globin [Woeseiaceae bacterium]